ncbi:MAG: YeeE/YedE family protein [Nitrosopumilus sp.]|nr:YeeE/YedE family protein [Nitrosopumilus sp.]
MVFDAFSSANQAVMITVFLVAALFGIVANKTNFCTMGSISDLVNMGESSRMRSWILAMAIAIIGVIILETSGIASVDISRPPYRSSNFIWLEYILGGLIFGVGMTLGSGCGNTTLIRLGGGNLKSIIVFSMIAISAYFMLNPFPGTDKTLYSELFYYWMSPLAISLTTQQDLGSVLGGIFGTDALSTRIWVGGILATLMLVAVFSSPKFRKRKDSILAGTVVGLCILAGWYVTTDMVTISMEGDTYSWVQFASTDVWGMMADGPQPRAVAVQSFTFINPAGETLGFLLNKFDSYYLTFGVIAVFGMISGSFILAVVAGKFRIEWFASFKDFISHVIGGVLMGIGGVLAMGCTIGQGITGVSTLAMGSFLALFSIMIACAMTMKFQLYKMMYESEATISKIFLTALVDFRVLPKKMRKLDPV